MIEKIVKSKFEKKMARSIMIIILLILSTVSFGQQIRLKKNIQIDTLRVCISFSNEIELEMKKSLDSIFNLAIADFNSSSSSFIILYDSVNKKNMIKMHMGNIKYVTTKSSVLLTGIDLVLIAGHVFMIGTYGWTLPIWPFLLPATHSKVELSIDPNIVKSKYETRMWINPNGYFMKKPKQKDKFKKKFFKKITKFFNTINNQNIKNNK